ncbi:hypothetical protein NJC40_03580 [Pseudomonas sp. 21LCFQ02]|uniref:hypothetical protein n=1 Tax=Pseudomonas sp. 21LCFQ02 TaxID=2957505 RepID=UPI00209AF1B9|nr:hypothetical protein [Pseudomonas sp. 21LCFQ02]MCO8166859.1 hypothetical protein [Pseudomonas sp. 21LCFQ02]
MTDTNKMRGEFEAWVNKNIGHGWLRRHDSRGDEYLDNNIQILWECWQASRQAVVVELPDTVANTGTLTSNAVLSYKRECKEAIEAAGLRCEVKL